MSIFLTDFRQGNLLANERQYEKAHGLFIRHAERHPEDAAKSFTRAGECAIHMNTLKEPVQVHPAATLIFKGDSARAEKMFRLALKADPNYSKAMKLLARLLPEKSEERFLLLEQALAIQPDYLTFLSLGDYHRSVRKDYQLAYDAYFKARQRQPRGKSAYLKLIDICKKLGKPQEAVSWSQAWKAVSK